MAARKGGELVYVGEVGTAFARRMSRALRKLLEGIVAKKPTVNLKRNNAIFTVPLLFAEVEFRACRCHRHANKAGRAKAPLSSTLSLQEQDRSAELRQRAIVCSGLVRMRQAEV